MQVLVFHADSKSGGNCAHILEATAGSTVADDENVYIAKEVVLDEIAMYAARVLCYRSKGVHSQRDRWSLAVSFLL